jgi:hypothetical protein
MELPQEVAQKQLLSGMQEWLNNAQPGERVGQVIFAFDTGDPQSIPTIRRRLEELRQADNNHVQFNVLEKLGMVLASNATAAQAIDLLSLEPVRAAELDQGGVVHPDFEFAAGVEEGGQPDVDLKWIRAIPGDRALQKPNDSHAEDAADRNSERGPRQPGG